MQVEMVWMHGAKRMGRAGCDSLAGNRRVR